MTRSATQSAETSSAQAVAVRHSPPKHSGNGLTPLGSLAPGAEPPAFSPSALVKLAGRFREGCFIIQHPESGHIGVAFDGEARVGATAATNRGGEYRLLACLPPIYPEWLGDRSFNECHGVRFPYVAGEMAQGLATPRMVLEMGRAGMLGFLGAAGLAPHRVRERMDEIAAGLGGRSLPWGVNLIHSPQTPSDEEHTVDLLIERKVKNVSASAFMKLGRSVVRYAASGLRVDESGAIVRDHRVFAKLSRPEVAEQFLAPPPAEMLNSLVRDGAITDAQAQLALRLPVAEDITVEADSGGHTDNRPLNVLFASVAGVRDRLVAQYGYTRPVRVGAAGGIGTPASAASAFAMGAAFVLTGSVNQCAVESGLSELGRKMLVNAEFTDVTMAPAADMFEMGVKVQVLKRGTMFPMRAQTLYEVYSTYDSLESIPAPLRQKLERDIFRATLEEIWEKTFQFWQAREPREAERAQRDPKHRMALVFRWYLGNAAGWARNGTADRQLDYQIWCGPAMGGFNAWVRGSVLEPLEARTVVQIARNILEGAAQVTRMQQWRSHGVPVPASAFDFRPRSIHSTQ